MIIEALFFPVLAWLALPIVVIYLASDELLRVRFSRHVLGCGKYANEEMIGPILRPNCILVRWTMFIRSVPFAAPLCPLLVFAHEPAMAYIGVLHITMFAAVATVWHVGISPKPAVLTLVLLALPVTALCCGVNVFPQDHL